MSNRASHAQQPTRSWVRTIALATIITGILDCLFSSTLAVGVYRNATFEGVWRGVASVVVGRQALSGGHSAAALGLVIHFAVACFWSTVFFLLLTRARVLPTALRTRAGVVATAAVYGPLIWVVMSLLVIPLATRRPPVIGVGWWVQFVGHFPFVGLPIVRTISGHPSSEAGRSYLTPTATWR